MLLFTNGDNECQPTYVGILALNEWTLINYKKNDTGGERQDGATCPLISKNATLAKKLQ